MARLLLDEDLGPTVARLLTEAGHDVRAIILETRGIGDIEVLAEAVRDQRILITCDRDYVRLVLRQLRPAPPALVHLRIDPATRVEKARAITSVLDSFDIAGKFVTVKQDEITLRPLPDSTPRTQ